MYSNNVQEWDGTATPLGEQRGWMGQIWTALVDNTTDEPTPDSADWQLDTEVALTGVTLLTIENPIDFLQTKVTGVTIMQEHINRPPEVYLGGITLHKFRNKPYLKILIS